MISKPRLIERFSRAFGGQPDLLSAAPGRVEFIGNHTDYNQGPVIGAAIDRRVYAALRRTREPKFRFASGADGAVVEVLDPSRPTQGPNRWVNYPLGVYAALIRRGLVPDGGFEIAFDSDVPPGAGLSSSAAIELATAFALNAAYGLQLDAKELALCGREAENTFVGVPCGILDQGVSAYGEAGHLVLIDCRSNAFSRLAFPGGSSIWIFNTSKKHSLLDSLYAKRHAECHEAVDRLRAAGLAIDCLADVSIGAFEESRSALPATVAKRAEHVIREIARVREVESALRVGDLRRVGRLLVESHASSRDLFENSIVELDFLVDTLSAMPGVLGARLTGGGFGGAAMALAEPEFTEAYAQSVAAGYRGKFGYEPEVIRCAIGGGASLL